MRRLVNRLYYFVESLLSRGTLYQLLFVALAIVALSVLGGGTVYLLSPKHADFTQSVWWAFLRLSDPGYLGDDYGTVSRTISTVLTIAGYVFFLGALVAIMTNMLNRFMSNLASGFSPIFEEDHILIIGWNPRIHSLIEEIAHAEQRVKRRLGRATLPAIVILTEEFESGLRKELMEKLDESVRERVRVLIRAGNPLEAESLERVDFARASSILLVSPSEGGRNRHLSDIRLVKILLSLKAETRNVAPKDLPNVVLEIGNPANKILAENAGWPRRTEAIASDEFMSRLVSHTIRNPGLSGVYNHLLTDTFGQSIYMVRASRLGVSGGRLREAVRTFERAVPIGMLRRSGAAARQEGRLQLLQLDEAIDPEDELIFVAPGLEDAHARFSPDVPERETTRLAEDSEVAVHSDDVAPLLGADGSTRKLMFVGWNHLLTPIFRELSSYESEHFDITLVTARPPTAARDDLRFDFERYDHMRLECKRASLDHPESVEQLAPTDIDNVVLLGSELSDDPLMEDAETIMSFVQLREYFQGRAASSPPAFVIELNDEDNRNLFQFGDYHDVVMTQEIVSHLISQVGMRPALAWIYEELFTKDGAEIRLCAADRLFESTPDESMDFQSLQALCLRIDAVALGVRHREPRDGRRIRLNPPRDEPLVLGDDDQVILVSNTTIPEGQL